MSWYEDEKGDFHAPKAGLYILGLIALITVFFTTLSFLSATFKPWFAEQDGRAELAQAEQNRQIAVLEATAKREAAVQLADAEIERARGVAEANRIIGDSLKGNEDYLRYLYINGITEGAHAGQIIYIPTEAGIPILEAGRR
jgi:regulator of protease activity HflC (stomatin/prohibitin superfamily)